MRRDVSWSEGWAEKEADAHGVPLGALTRQNTRLARRCAADLRLIGRATQRIRELSVTLDRQMLGDARPQEQLRHLRQATGQITRSANDGIQAYRRVAQVLRAEAEHANADSDEIERAGESLAAMRAEMLEALEVASRRYPWADPWRPDDEAAADPREAAAEPK
jgi:HAMP domain-containing protein